jgi:predicted nucleic acid-binding protein
MMATLVDSNILLDLMTEDENWFEWSSNALAREADERRLVINAIVYAEISVRFTRIEELEATLAQDIFQREAIPFEAAFLAAKAFVAYRKRGGAKTNVLPDFLIGAHAAVAGYRLLTRDAARYRTAFPALDVLAPS